jgi:C4-dicarboxylate-specific signal transduction histidine kinase
MQMNSVTKPGPKTNSTVQSQKFKIGNEAMMIDIARNRLYSEPIQTLVQEYISNARDANRESQSKRPIEVTAPSEDDLVLRIRDFGPGLSPERVAEVFIQY